MAVNSSIFKNRAKVTRALDNVKGAIDAWSFKNLFFTFLFIRITHRDRFKKFVEEHLPKWERSNLAYIKVEVNTFIRSVDVRKVGLVELAAINQTFRGLNDEEIGHKLAYLMREINDLDLSEEQDFGEFYEYLIDQFGQRAGKSAGEFYTPKCLSELLFQIVDRLKPDKKVVKVYDPTSGTGTLLLMCRKMKCDVIFYGQELNRRSYDFAHLNMVAHNIKPFCYWLEHGDTLVNDKFKDRQFDVVVSNYPYGIRWDNTKADPARFPHGIPPPTKADYAFIQHMLNKLDWGGVCAVLCFPGILFRENKEGQIRKSLIKSKQIRAVVQLPTNLFYGTSIAPALLVFNKARFEHTKNDSILFVDATDAFVKQVKQHTLSQDVIEFIANLVANPKPILGGIPPRGTNIHWINVPIEKVLAEGNDGCLCPSQYVRIRSEQNRAYVVGEESKKRTIKLLEFLKGAYKLEKSAREWFYESSKETDEFLETLEKYVKPLWEKYESEV